MTTDKEEVQHAEESYKLHPDTIHFIIQALEENDTSRVCELASDMHAADIAELVTMMKSDQRQAFIDTTRDIFDPEMLLDLESSLKDEVIEILGAEESAAAITQLDAEDAVQVMEDLEKEEQQEILEAIDDKDQRAVVEDYLAYEEDTAGRIMSRNIVAVPVDWTVGDAIDYLRKQDDLPDDFYTIFIKDKEGHPIGWVLVSRVMRKERDVKLQDIMKTELRTIPLDMDQEEVAYVFRKYGLASAPVVDKDNTLVGMISLDDVVDVIDEEAAEDILHMGGVGTTDLHSAFVTTAYRRFPWLFINLLTAIAASAVIALFEGTIQQLVALAVLMPIVASMAGNAGTQTLTIAVRAIATKELTGTNAMRVVRKEINASIINGVLFGIIVGIVSFFYYHNIELSIVFAIATFVALLIAALAGAVIPLFLVRVGVDPAIASGVFLTTITDIAAFFIFLGLAAMWLIH